MLGFAIIAAAGALSGLATGAWGGVTVRGLEVATAGAIHRDYEWMGMSFRLKTASAFRAFVAGADALERVVRSIPGVDPGEDLLIAEQVVAGVRHNLLTMGDVMYPLTQMQVATQDGVASLPSEAISAIRAHLCAQAAEMELVRNAVRVALANAKK
jgi:hypothetical protein